MYKKILVPMALDHGHLTATLANCTGAGWRAERLWRCMSMRPQGSVNAYLTKRPERRIARAKAELLAKTAASDDVQP